jgi:Caspase domain
MELDSNSTTDRIFNSLINGREADRVAAQVALDAPDPTIDSTHLRGLILDALEQQFYPRKDEEERDAAVQTRAWLLGALARISNDDKKAAEVVRRHLDPEYEPDRWVRYWTLAGLVVAQASDLEVLAVQIIEKDQNPWPLMLAVAILASKGHSHAMQIILKGMEQPRLQVATLRALRAVPIPATIEGLCRIVESGGLEHGVYNDATYDAIIALGRVPSTWRQAKRAARTLETCVVQCRHVSWLVDIRAKALHALGNLKVKRTALLLLEQLIDDHASIVFEAARGLETVLGTRAAVARIVEAASKSDRDAIKGYASALRWMARGSVVEALEVALVSGTADQREAARTLLVEVGGPEALGKLRARTTATQHATTVVSIKPDKSRVVLLGASKFPRDPEHMLPLPQVRANIKELVRLLADPKTIGMPSTQITILLDKTNIQNVYEALAKACHETVDTLLVYYAGHGLVGKIAPELYLATAGTTEAQCEFNALSFQHMRLAIANSPAAKKILILDCCFSGRALNFMGPGEALLQSNLDLQGTFVIASAPANKPAIAPQGAKFTAFTAELIRTLSNGIDNDRKVITLEELYQSVRMAIQKNPNLPAPLRATIEDMDKIAIAYNRWQL